MCVYADLFLVNDVLGCRRRASFDVILARDEVLRAV